jgi:hypothetical protein
MVMGATSPVSLGLFCDSAKIRYGRVTASSLLSTYLSDEGPGDDERSVDD